MERGDTSSINIPSSIFCVSLSTGERAGQFSSVERTGKTLPRQLDEPYLLDLASATTVASTAVDLSTV